MKARTSMRIVTSNSDEYQPARTRPELIEDKWEPDASRYDDSITVPIAAGSYEVGDVEFTEVVIRNLDDTNFVKATWRNDDATTGGCQIPAGRTMKLPWVNGAGATNLTLVADTADCKVEIFVTI